MKVAVIGSRGITSIDDLASYLPADTTCIVSGGARGVDTLARAYALSHSLNYQEILPDYKTYGSRAPLVRNNAILDCADCVIAFWDGKSHGTAYTVRRCHQKGIPVRVFLQVKRDMPKDPDQIGFFDDEKPPITDQFCSADLLSEIEEDYSDLIPNGDEQNW